MTKTSVNHCQTKNNVICIQGNASIPFYHFFVILSVKSGDKHKSNVCNYRYI
uniref:Uncharacterized protein n=1 Tax=Anguilla anguilla TaxID=7936 RepID=A0A0E9URL5_ANGAN